MESFLSSKALQEAMDIISSTSLVYKKKAKETSHKFNNIYWNTLLEGNKIDKNLSEILIQDIRGVKSYRYKKPCDFYDIEELLEYYSKEEYNDFEYYQKKHDLFKDIFELLELKDKINNITKVVRYLKKIIFPKRQYDERNKIKSIKSNLRYTAEEEELMLKLLNLNFNINLNFYSLWKSNKSKIQLMTYY